MIHANTRRNYKSTHHLQIQTHKIVPQTHKHTHTHIHTKQHTKLTHTHGLTRKVRRDSSGFDRKRLVGAAVFTKQNYYF